MSDTSNQPNTPIGEKESNQEPRSWKEFLEGPNYFEDCYTIDPYNVEDAWEKLGQSTLYLQLAALPTILFFGFKDTFEEYFGKKGIN